MNLGGTVRINRTGWIALAALVCLLLVVQYVRSPTSAAPSPALDRRYSLGRLLRAAVEAARAGGEAVVGVAHGEPGLVRSKGKTLEGAEQPVTAADLDSHCRMVAAIESAFPGVALVSEEHPEGACPPGVRSEPLGREGFPELPDEYVLAEDVAVWIDPLDATQEFTEKLYKYVTTMVCVAIKGVPVIGVIHRPFEKETFWTWLSIGSSQNLKNVANENKETPTKAVRVIVSRSHQGEVKKYASSVFGEDHEVIAAAGAGYKVLELVHNRADVYLHKTRIKKWDTCAGNAILSHLNGKMTTLKNSTIDYSHGSAYEIDDGLLASLTNHNKYIEKVNQIKN